jgi:hypothetical protein
MAKNIAVLANWIQANWLVGGLLNATNVRQIAKSSSILRFHLATSI